VSPADWCCARGFFGAIQDFQFVFNVFSFANSQDPMGKAVSYSIVEEDFMFERACDQVLRRRLPCSTHTLARLASLRCQCIFGDYQVRSSTEQRVGLLKHCLPLSCLACLPVSLALSDREEISRGC